MTETEQRIGDSFQLFSGKPFYPLDPRPRDICIEDIAHALSRICRFGGHCKQFYSVAQHSVMVSLIVPKQFALEGLLHDAAEAYVGDMVKPLKNTMPDFEHAEFLIYAAVAAKFNVPPNISREVKQADHVMLATEARDLMHAEHPTWHKWISHITPLAGKIVPLSPIAAESLFRERYVALTKDSE
jgi:5'-deoxynucleotidase YfbR-like HD superfamily hydrolase